MHKAVKLSQGNTKDCSLFRAIGLVKRVKIIRKGVEGGRECGLGVRRIKPVRGGFIV